ncbi:hypothetical protein [Aquimarina sp. LLG6339-5]|uniref:hypothetical protein n=1 Tax=Aquimarina sp. LLG6339-5 TaxID=3160830 RepID=UPI00386DF056
MIRQFFLNKVTIICTMVLMAGCTSDSVTNDITIEETTEAKWKPYIDIDGKMEVLIVYVEGTPESVKNEVRELYKELLLISDIVQCEDDDKETWTVEAARMPGPLTDTSSDEPLREAIQYVIFNTNCDKSNGRN